MKDASIPAQKLNACESTGSKFRRIFYRRYDLRAGSQVASAMVSGELSERCERCGKVAAEPQSGGKSRSGHGTFTEAEFESELSSPLEFTAVTT